MREFIEKLLRRFQWLFEFSATPFDNYAHAGKAEGKTLDILQILALRLSALIASAQDCLFVDVSRWQTIIDWVKTVLAGARGAIIKCGQGLGTDPYFFENWRKAKTANLKRGTYWYYDSRVEPKEQARIWWNAIKDDIGELPHFADYEEKYGGPFAGVNHFTEFLMEFKRLSGLPDERIGIYTGYYYWISQGANDSFFSRFWLWIAWYGPASNVLIPKPWTVERVWGWQWTDSGDGKLFGVSSNEIDLNWFVKGLEVFEKMYGDTQEPETGEPMSGLFEVWSDLYFMSLREGPSINTPKVGESLPRLQRVKADAIVPPSSGGLVTDKWAHVVERDGRPVDLYIAIVHNGDVYCRFEPVEDGTRPVPHVKFEFTDRDGAKWIIDQDMTRL